VSKIAFFVLLCAYSLTLNAANIVDVYGVDLRESENIIKNYGTLVGDIESQFIKEMITISNGGKDHYIEKVVLPKKTQLINEIKKHYNFAFVQFDTIFYPNDKDTHTTIEVITQNDKNRLRFIPQKNKVQSTPKLKHDLVDNMMKFHDKSMNLLVNNQLNSIVTKCPVYHCLPGFNHPELKDSFTSLTHQARKEKALLINTIDNDLLPERRVAAVYLVGYLDDPHEIISLLTKHVMDSDDGVRNSAMRVIAETMRKAKIDEINVKPFLELLDSPYDTDRNKALYVLLSASNLPLSKQLIIRDGNKQLMALLQLKQPNNHDIAYALLKNISGKDFGSQNIDAWKKWITKEVTDNKNILAEIHSL
jgi:hypothetical protein